jgi:hypothetical protein
VRIYLYFISTTVTDYNKKRKNIKIEGSEHPKIKTMNESTRRQWFRRYGSFDLRHGCHKGRVTIKSDFIGVLSHKDQNTKTTEVNMGRRIQNKSSNKQKTTAAEHRVDEGWEPS